MKKIIFVSLISLLFSITSCKKSKEPELPTISLKTGGNYISQYATVNSGQTITAGIIADKNETDLRTFRVYVSYGAEDFSLKNTYTLKDNETEHYESDYKINPQNDGSETWKFEITDRNGNINYISLFLSVN